MDNNFSLFQFLQYKFFKLEDRVSKLPDSSTQQALLQTWKSHLKNNPIISSSSQQQQQQQQQQEEEEHFSSLPFPSEILVHILSYLPFHQVLHQSSVNKSWYVASCDDYLWTVFLMHWMQSYDCDYHDSLLWNNDFLDSLLLSSSTTTTTINNDDGEQSTSTVISIDEESMVNQVKTQQDAKWKMIEWFYRGRDEFIKQRQAYLEEMSHGTFNNNNTHHHPIFNTYHANNQSISSLIFQHLIAQTNNNNNNNNNNNSTNRKKRRKNSNENSLLLFDPIRMCYVTKKHLWGDCGTIVLGVAASVIYLLSQSRIRSLMSQRTVLKSMLMGTLVNTIMRYALWDAYYDDKRRYRWKSGRWPHTGVAFLIGCLCTLRATEGWRESSLE